MSVTSAPVLNDVYTAMAAFLSGALGLASTQIIQGLGNRAAMPLPGFIAMTAIDQKRLMTTVDSYAFIASPTTMSYEQDVELTMQIDFYGPLSGDWSAQISTLFRDEYGVDALGPNCAPLYADHARMIPLTNAENQYEQRWSLDCAIQYNPVVTAPQQFANTLTAELISVDQAYPPS